MKHLFVDYELAVKLKEKGFDEPCLAGFLIADDGQFSIYGIDTNHESLSEIEEENWLNAPLYQQVVDWLLDNHEIDIDTHYNSNLTKKHQFQIHTKDGFCKVDSDLEFDSKHEMLTKAIEEALKLIPEPTQ